MSDEQSLLTRSSFAENVMSSKKGRWAFCDRQGVDANHIMG